MHSNQRFEHQKSAPNIGKIINRQRSKTFNTYLEESALPINSQVISAMSSSTFSRKSPDEESDFMNIDFMSSSHLYQSPLPSVTQPTLQPSNHDVHFSSAIPQNSFSSNQTQIRSRYEQSRSNRGHHLPQRQNSSSGSSRSSSPRNRNTIGGQCGPFCGSCAQHTTQQSSRSVNVASTNLVSSSASSSISPNCQCHSSGVCNRVPPPLICDQSHGQSFVVSGPQHSTSSFHHGPSCSSVSNSNSVDSNKSLFGCSSTNSQNIVTYSSTTQGNNTSGNCSFTDHSQAKSHGSESSQVVQHRANCPNSSVQHMHRPNCRLSRLRPTSVDLDYLTTSNTTSGSVRSVSSTVKECLDHKPHKPQPRHDLIEFTFLLPNGCSLTLLVYDDATLKSVKRELWLRYKALVKGLEPTKPTQEKSSKIGSRLRVFGSKAFRKTPTETASKEVSSSGTPQSFSDLYVNSMKHSQTVPAIASTVIPSDFTVEVADERPAKSKSKNRLSFSFKKRSPSTRKFHSMKNGSVDTTLPIGTVSSNTVHKQIESDNDNANASLNRSMSVRKRVFNGIFSKLRRNDSTRSNSISFPASSTTPNETSKSPSLSLSTSASQNSFTSPELINGSNISTFSVNDSNDHKQSVKTIIEEDQFLKDKKTNSVFQTTASMVLPDFNNDANGLFSEIFPGPESKELFSIISLADEDPSDYIFSGITMEGKIEEFCDDSMRLFDLNLFMPILRLVEAIGNKKEKLLNHIVSSIIGKPLNELDSIRTDEFCQFRQRMHATMLDTVQTREAMTLDNRLLYEFPPELDDIDTLTLSTMRINGDLKRFEKSFCKESSDDENIEERSNSISSQHSNYAIPRVKNHESGKPCFSENIHFKDAKIELSMTSDRTTQSEEEKPVYTEVVALKRSRLFNSFKKNEPPLATEYPTLIILDKESKSKLKSSRIETAEIAIVEEDKMANFSNKNQEEDVHVKFTPKTSTESRNTSELLTRKLQESQQQNQKGEYAELSNEEKGDHYEMCFDQSNSDNPTLSVRPQRLNCHVWTSLATVIYGAMNGEMSFGGDYGPLLDLFDEITDDEKTTKDLTKKAKHNECSNRNKVMRSNSLPAKSDNKATANSKSVTRRFLGRFRRTSKNTLNAIVEGNAQTQTQPIDQSAASMSQALQNSSSQTKENEELKDSVKKEVTLIRSATLEQPSPLNLEEMLVETTSITSKSIHSTRPPKSLPKPERATVFDSRPYLQPHLYQVNCQPNGISSCELIQRLLKQYSVWLRGRLQEMLVQMRELAKQPSTATHSTSFAHHPTLTTVSIGKTISKFLTPKTPLSNSGGSGDSKFNDDDTSAYVKLNYCPSVPSASNSDNSRTKKLDFTDVSSIPTNSDKSHTSKPYNLEISKVQQLLELLEQNELLLQPENYLIKICGYEQYLLGGCKLITFDYIRNCLLKGSNPQLILISKKAIVAKIPKYIYIQPYFLRRLPIQPPNDTLFENEFELMPLTKENPMITWKNKEDQVSSDILNETDNCLSLVQSPLEEFSNTIDKSQNSNVLNNNNEQTTQTIVTDTDYAVISADQTMRQRKQSEDYNKNFQQSQEIILKAAADENCTNIEEYHTTPEVLDVANFQNLTQFTKEPKEDEESLDTWIEHGIAHQSLISLWKISTVFRVRVLLATYVNVKDVDKIYVRAGIFHGSESLCAHQCTRQVEPQNPRWEQLLEFDKLCFLDLPLSATLSIALCAVVNRKKPAEEFATAWINLQLFNYKRCLLTGRMSLSLWPMPKGFEGFLNPFGHSGSNTNRYQAPRIQIEFDTFQKPVVFPPKSLIREYATVVTKQEEQFIQRIKDLKQKSIPVPAIIEDRQLTHDPTGRPYFEQLVCLSFFNGCSSNRFYRSSSHRHIAGQLKTLISRLDPFSELSEQEKDLFWRERVTVLNACPDALPKVLEAVRWSCREEVCQMYQLLDRWADVSVDTAIILLGARYTDTIVREFAVNSLDRGLTDSLMVHYLLQLIQLLRNEPYHDSALARLLLRRALLNRRFGNLFFWNLRSQMDDSMCTSRWFVLLEMYCRGLSENALRNTLQQVEALGEIERISVETINETDRREAIMKHFHLENVLFKVCKYYNPLNITIPLDKLIHDRCRVMDSAKRPLWLEWTNADPFAKFNGMDRSAVIFKTGDDLRQDMLTLQVIRIMDLIWRRQNLDLKMLPYNCLATGDQVGLIEVVAHAQTVMGIQRCGGRMAALQVDSSKLHKWIKDHNADNYEHAVDNFTRSCAGYCVATFILGIGDRNPDNIMVNEHGQIFHIDFGHFLGHFKKKFGINRERVPFVLTYDFLQVITKGADDPLKSKEFEAFQTLCYKAYLALHDNAQLLISLFVMMLGTGIPELQTLEDVQYLRQTLQVDKTRDEARLYFETQLDEAHGGAWSTKLDWFFHSVKHA